VLSYTVGLELSMLGLRRSETAVKKTAERLSDDESLPYVTWEDDLAPFWGD